MGVDGKKIIESEEVDGQTKAGTAWSHNYLNQKPWHPLSYRNQQRRWIAEQKNAQKDKRLAEIEKEFQKEQDFFKQSAPLSGKSKKKAELFQSVSFLYAKPPGYNAESARAAELADEQRKELLANPAAAAAAAASQKDAVGGPSEQADDAAAGAAAMDPTAEEKEKKKVVLDVFGRRVATGEDFAMLQNAPREDTGIVGRVKPLGLEVRNVKCIKCGALGHQAGDRECGLRDIVTPLEEERQKREDPLSVILAHNRSQPFNWELKHTPGCFSPIRGGFSRDDPNQQILPPDLDEPGAPTAAVFDEYGGFLAPPDADASEQPSGMASSILHSLTKRQRKELKSALKQNERDQHKKKPKRSREKEKKHDKRRGKKKHKDNDREMDRHGRDSQKRQKGKGGDKNKRKGGGSMSSSSSGGSIDTSNGEHDSRRRKTGR